MNAERASVALISAPCQALRRARTQQPVATVPVTIAYAIQAGRYAACSGMKACAASARPSVIAVESAA